MVRGVRELLVGGGSEREGGVGGDREVCVYTFSERVSERREYRGRWPAPSERLISADARQPGVGVGGGGGEGEGGFGSERSERKKV